MQFSLVHFHCSLYAAQEGFLRDQHDVVFVAENDQVLSAAQTEQMPRRLFF